MTACSLIYISTVDLCDCLRHIIANCRQSLVFCAKNVQIYCGRYVVKATR